MIAIGDQATTLIESYLVEYPEAHLLEIGSGPGTIWLASKTGNLTSVEEDPLLYRVMQTDLDFLCYYIQDYFLASPPFREILDTYEEGHFDLVFVDRRYGEITFDLLLSKVKRGGILFLDEETEISLPGEQWEPIGFNSPFALKWNTGWRRKS